MLGFDAFLFDADNTIFDFDRAQREAFAETVSEDPAVLQEFRAIGSELWSRLERGELDHGRLQKERFLRLSRQCPLAASPEEVAAAYAAAIARRPYLAPKAAQVLDLLSRRATLALVSNGFSDSLRARLVRSEIEIFFQGIFASEEMGLSKPNPAFFHAVVSQLHLMPERTLCVGDSLRADIAGAARAGIRTCWYNPRDRRQQGSGPVPDLTITDLEELLPLASPPS